MAPPASGGIVTHSLCPECGPPIVSATAATPGMILLRASSLDHLDQAAPQMVVYKSCSPKWGPADPGLPAFGEMSEGNEQTAYSAAIPTGSRM